MGRIWQLQDAKAQFSQVVRLAQTEGPQRVTLHGKEVVTIVASSDSESLAARAKPVQGWYSQLWVPITDEPFAELSNSAEPHYAPVRFDEN